MEEIWRDIKGYLGLYQASNYGRVKSLERVIIRNNGSPITIKERILKPQKDKKTGYLLVALYKDGKKTYCLVHRLVAEAFIPNPENKPCIDHINTDKTDNRVENLRWATRKENRNNPLSKKHYSEAKIGDKNPMARAVLQFDLQGNFMCEWPSISDVERKFGFASANICMCCKGKLKSAYKFIWRYKEEVEEEEEKILITKPQSSQLEIKF